MNAHTSEQILGIPLEIGKRQIDGECGGCLAIFHAPANRSISLITNIKMSDIKISDGLRQKSTNFHGARVRLPKKTAKGQSQIMVRLSICLSVNRNVQTEMVIANPG